MSLISPKTPKQDQLKCNIDAVNAQLAAFATLKANRPLSVDDKAQVTSLQGEKRKLEKELSRLKSVGTAQKKFREKKRKAVQEVCEKSEECAEILKKCYRQAKGRPNLEKDNPELQRAIIKLVVGEAGADNRRRSEVLNSCRTLDDLAEKLADEGFVLSRSALYLRLYPRRWRSHEGERHVHTVPMKLIRAQNTLRKEHQDQHFASATIHYLKDLAAFLGPDLVLFLSQDDKARVPLGLPAATKQAPILMHLQYRVELPDHDWVIAERHKLIPSVYAVCTVETSNISYSGPTYIAVRSGKHDKSTAESHSKDFKDLLMMEEFKVCLTPSGALKPILVVAVDGGPDENPRYPKTLIAWANIFDLYNLDVLFVATNAPGCSAYNAVERRMAPLSHDLAGLIIPHDSLGSHLDSSGKTKDDALESANFERAGEILCEVWNKTVIDGYPVVAQYIKPGQTSQLKMPSQQWRDIHVRQSQYCLQIARCSNPDCCGEWRTDFMKIFPEKFLPPPVSFTRTSTGFLASDPVDRGSQARFFDLFRRTQLQSLEPNTDFKLLPFDFYCPSVHAVLADRCCKTCGMYFPSKKFASAHFKQCKPQRDLFGGEDYFAATRRENLLSSSSDEEDEIEIATSAEQKEQLNDLSQYYDNDGNIFDKYAYMNVFQEDN